MAHWQHLVDVDRDGRRRKLFMVTQDMTGEMGKCVSHKGPDGLRALLANARFSPLAWRQCFHANSVVRKLSRAACYEGCFLGASWVLVGRPVSGHGCCRHFSNTTNSKRIPYWQATTGTGSWYLNADTRLCNQHHGKSTNTTAASPQF